MCIRRCHICRDHRLWKWLVGHSVSNQPICCKLETRPPQILIKKLPFVQAYMSSKNTNFQNFIFHTFRENFFLKAIASIQFWHQRLAILCCKLPRQSYKFAAPSMTSQTKRRHHDVIPHAVVDNFTKILKSHDKSHQITTYSRWHANFLRLFDDIRCKQCWQKFLGKSPRNFLHN